MSSSLVISPFLSVGAALGAFGAIFIVAAIAALVQARPLRFALRALAGLLLLTIGVLVSAIAVGIQGYRALTREDLAAQISVRPAGVQRFDATFRFADGREAAFQLAGDEIYVDAHILKWKPLANVLGLRTAYELDRVTGRYDDIQQERTAVRTIYSLSEENPVDLFGLRQRYAFLSPLFDAEYGSATFVPVNHRRELELLVSTTGLLIRETSPGRK
ncbi:MAG TPA: hypothetical protein VK440_03850 [Burkholderiales bacterium]|nr:hypothetical protein [Burkholderiales bacterium]